MYKKSIWPIIGYHVRVYEKREQVLKGIPSLLGLYNSIENLPKVEVFEELEGIKTILNDLVKTGKEILIYSSAAKQLEMLNHHFLQYIQRRAEAKVKAKVIIEKSDYSLKLKKKDKKEHRETRFFPKKISLNSATHIYGDKVAVFSLDGPLFGIIIENKEIAESQRTIFQILWKRAFTK
ncbi:MAG: hypothetical protein U9R00_00035 [Patescibacteria group bacterium]|nr:hypothetical protein [Patescibacteria group bacterium]